MKQTEHSLQRQKNKYTQNKITNKEQENDNNKNKKPKSKEIENKLTKSDEKQFEFKLVENDVMKIVNHVIDSLLQQRNTILLAKLAKDNLFSQQQHSLSHNKSLPTQLPFSLENPLLHKSLDELNNHYCNEISSQIIKKIVSYLKGNNYHAKVVSTSWIIDNPKFGYNFSGVCFWDGNVDGQKTFTRKMPILESHKPTTMEQEPVTQQETAPRQSLLIVTVYLVRFEQNFRAKSY